MKRQLLCLLLLLVVLPLGAQIRGNNIVVTVEPDHQDWNYKVGEKCKFNVEVRRSGTLLDNVDIDYEAGPEMYPDVNHLEKGDYELYGPDEDSGLLSPESHRSCGRQGLLGMVHRSLLARATEANDS